MVCNYFKLSFAEILLAQQVQKHVITVIYFDRITWKSDQIYRNYLKAESKFAHVIDGIMAFRKRIVTLLG